MYKTIILYLILFMSLIFVIGGDELVSFVFILITLAIDTFTYDNWFEAPTPPEPDDDWLDGILIG